MISVHVSDLLLSVRVACPVLLGQVAGCVVGDLPLLLLFALGCADELLVESIACFFLHLETLLDSNGSNFVGDVS